MMYYSSTNLSYGTNNGIAHFFYPSNAPTAHGAICMLNNDITVEMCDATMLNSVPFAGLQIQQT